MGDDELSGGIVIILAFEGVGSTWKTLLAEKMNS
jgi:hypothetical protein